MADCGLELSLRRKSIAWAAYFDWHRWQQRTDIPAVGGGHRQLPDWQNGGYAGLG